VTGQSQDTIEDEEKWKEGDRLLFGACAFHFVSGMPWEPSMVKIKPPYSFHFVSGKC